MTEYRIIDDLSAGGVALETLLLSLPEWRREEALKFRHERGRRECCLSYLLLRDVLQQCFGVMQEPCFERLEHGKPRLLLPAADGGDMVSWDGHGLFFNLSHCRRALACVVSDEGEVGIDVECTGRYNARLAEYCMSEAENSRIVAADDPDGEFTLLWTRKEALLKLTGEGITDDMRTVLSSARMEGVTMHSHICREKGYAWTVALRT
ncbi:MAG: 4'-phosphopantetheinyl transferase superfamily protein [Prevotella sp.]|nr:4'-phosphopantetheinyl transferase superfamily protein [Prevotella sp.]